MYFKQIDEILSGAKTQTRRVYKLGEYAVDANEFTAIAKNGTVDFADTIHSVYTSAERLKWQVGGDYAVSPGRGKPGLWWHPETKAVALPYKTKRYKTDLPQMLKSELVAKGYIPLRIRFTEIRREPLIHISVDDALAEGCPDQDAGKSALIWYGRLWENINGAGSWAKNPDVWVLVFEVLRDD